MSARPLAPCVSLALTVGAACVACSPSPSPAPPPAVLSPPQASSTPPAAAPLAHVQILAINDFHGHLEPPAGNNGVVLVPADDPLASSADARATDAGVTLVPAGGAAYLSGLVARLRAENAATVVVSAGDLTGASPLISNLFADEPTVLVMNRVGLDLEGIGNHDFDRGVPELRRLQQPGCSLGDCDAGSYPGAAFQYLAANVLDTATGRPIFPPYAIRDVGGVRVAFIGETLRETPTVTRLDAVKGLSFGDEATIANALVPELQGQGVSAIVLLVHQGGKQATGGTYDGCSGFSGDLVPILDRLSPAIDVVVSGHTHQAYDCVVGGRLVTSASSYGRSLTKIDLTIDPASRRVVDKHARNVAVTHDILPDPEVERIVATYAGKVRSVSGRIVGYVKGDLTGSARVARSPSCETPLGDVIADAMRESSGAQIAFMNAGGIRAELVARHPETPNAITYADAFEIQPFGNTLVTVTLTGAQLRTLLEEQFSKVDEPRILQVSAGFSYRYTYDPVHRMGVLSELRLNGKPIDPARSYRVTVPSFISAGGDGFSVLGQAAERHEGAIDVDALCAYLGKISSATTPLEAPRGGRIEGDRCR